MDYVARFLKYYPHEGFDRVWFRIPMDKGYALIAAAMNLDGWLAFSGVLISDGGYIRQEIEKMMKQKKP